MPPAELTSANTAWAALMKATPTPASGPVIGADWPSLIGGREAGVLAACTRAAPRAAGISASVPAASAVRRLIIAKPLQQQRRSFDPHVAFEDLFPVFCELVERLLRAAGANDHVVVHPVLHRRQKPGLQRLGPEVFDDFHRIEKHLGVRRARLEARRVQDRLVAGEAAAFRPLFLSCRLREPLLVSQGQLAPTCSPKISTAPFRPGTAVQPPAVHRPSHRRQHLHRQPDRRHIDRGRPGTGDLCPDAGRPRRARLRGAPAQRRTLNATRAAAR